MDVHPLEYDFETLVPGDENVLAISGALKVVAEPGERYNPLFVHGPPSVGKTHLVHALRRRFEAAYRDWNVLVLPASEFMEECDQAWRTNTVPEFRQQLWRLNVLMIDDVHELIRHPASLDELYHTFNRFLAESRQLVVTSRTPPAETNFPAPLRIRLQSGLVVGVEPPRERLLRDILDRTCQRRGLRPSPKAASFLCRELQSVRDLYGIIHQLERTRNGKPHMISLGEVRGLLDKQPRQKLTVGQVASAVCSYFDVELPNVRSVSRQQPLMQARQLAMYLARELTSAPLAEIGRFFGDRDHTTVMHACRKMAQELHCDDLIARAARDIRTSIQCC